MNSKLSRRLMILFGAALAIAALAAPSANAKMQRIYSDHGVALIPSDSQTKYSDTTMVFSDHGVAVIPAASDDTPRNIYYEHGIATVPPDPVSPTQVAVVSTPDPSGFNWSRAGFISSLALAGLFLLGGGLLLAGKRSRRERFAAA